MSLLLLLLLLYFSLLPSSSALEAVTPIHPLIDNGGRQTLQSKDGTFELGFFTPGESSKNRYLGIWYRNIPVRKVVWVANRDSPAIDNRSSLIINTAKNNSLVLVSSNKTVLWSSVANSNPLMLKNPVAELLETGNLVLRDQTDSINSGNYLWQSFDHPCDTLLPGMKLGWDSKTRLNRRLTSWKSPDDPSTGDFIWGVKVQSNPEVFMWKGSDKFFRSGPWNGLGFSAAPELKFTWDEDHIYYTYELKNKSFISIIVMNQTLYSRQRLVWNEVARDWGMYASVPRDRCDNYAICGVYATCAVSESPICQCLKGFKPKSSEMLDMMDWSHGCVRDKPLECSHGNGDGFLKHSGLKLPDATNSWVNKSMSLEECRVKCLENCSCMAYTSTDIRGAGNAPGGRSASKMTATIGRNEEAELPLFELATIVDATDNFSVSNKLGEGGYGPVYVGVMVDGQEIAVKRLSSFSGQGIKEFKNEVLLISKLQHRNLVKLLGCCIQGDEKMLVYEYMPNKSLDSFIFELNPKISDFGLARSFGGDASEGNTNRVVGTYGYMAPEYAADGLFSVKSDVFSFGILVLEIISRKKSRGFYHADRSSNLIGYAWKLWKEGKALEIMDSALDEECSENVSQVMRCIHIGLLCVQNCADDRPTMANVVMMLGGGEETAALLPQPKEPGFYNDKEPFCTTDSSSSVFPFSSTNELSLTVPQPR
ncbi:G-type lectin S-receptor-like serine/threonine-protein kinase At4g27290 [Linum perenne]